MREGDPQAGLAVAVWTYGIAPERGAQAAVALAALTQARLATRWPQAAVTPAWEGYRVRGLLERPSEHVAVMHHALLAPVNAQEMPAVLKKVRALANKPLPDPRLAEMWRCRGEPFGLVPPPAEPTLADVEAWRRAAHGRGRVAFSVVGTSRAASEVANALQRTAAWPVAARLPPYGWPDATPIEPVVYDARDGVSEARVTVAFRVADAARVASVVPDLADPRGPMLARLGAVEPSATVTELTATAHAQGGCLTVVLDVRELGTNPAARIASAIALVREEVLGELAGAASDAMGLALAARAGDPRDAAERAAWWSLHQAARGAAPSSAPKMLVAAGFAGSRDNAPPPPTAEMMRAEMDRATAAWRDPVVETRVRVERGQPEMFVLLASPCGTMPEVTSDGGLGAVFARLAADQARRFAEPSLEIEPWASFDAVGLVAHGPALPGETPAMHARRVADAMARSFAAETPDLALAARVRGSFLAANEGAPNRALLSLANAVVPGHPSWFVPSGNPDALARTSDGALLARAAALRSGPLRVAVLANADADQAAAAARAVDRWIPRRAGEARVCPRPSEPTLPRPGTYAVDSTGMPSEAWIAVPLPRGDERSVQYAHFLALAFDGEDGILARAVGAAGLARAWSARVVGPARGAALVLRITAAEGALDGAVAQVRVLLDRIRQRGLDEAERQRTTLFRARVRERALLEPRGRLLSLFRGEVNDAPPSLDALRSFASTVLRDDALVIVAARPPARKASP